MTADQPDIVERELDEGAVILHELFMSYVRAGFTRWEALILLMNHQNQWTNDPGEGPCG